MITGRSRSVSVLDHQTGSTSWIARGQVDALITDIAGDARISTSLSRRDRSRRFKIAVAGQYGPVSEALHGYDERVDVESVGFTKSIALFVAEWCGVAAAP